jgi:thiol-disulfide isomerase/thioredoxin
MATTTKKQAPTSKSKSIPIVGIVFAVIAVLAVVAVVFAGSSNSSNGADEFGEPRIDGQLSAMPPTAAVDTSAAGETAPTVIGKDFDGNTVTIENDGKAKAIVFLAHWCPHCQNEVPAIQAWLDAGGGVEGTEIYSVASAMDSSRDNYPASAWLDRENWTVPVIVDDAAGSIHRAYGAGGFPFWIFVNSDGTVALRAAGELGVDQLQTFLSSLS